MYSRIVVAPCRPSGFRIRRRYSARSAELSSEGRTALCYTAGRSPGRASMASLVSNVSTLVESGVRGPALTPRRVLALRLGAVMAFVALWCVVAALVVVLRLFNPIFLPGP